MPTPEAMKEVEEGRLALAGCMVGPDSPNRACLDCGAEWRVVWRRRSAKEV